MKFLDEFCNQIVEANMKKAQQMSPDQKQQQEQQNQEPPNAAPKAPTVEAPKAPVAPTVEAPKAPVAPTAMNPNPPPTANNTTETAAKEMEKANPNNVVTQAYQKNGTFSELVGKTINNSFTEKRKAYNHFNQQHIKKAILKEMDGKHCVVTFAGINDMFPTKMNSKSYDDLASSGMTNIFDIVDDTVNNFSISITTDDEKKIISHMKELATELNKLGFQCVVLLKDDIYEMQFSSDKNIETQKVLDIVLEKISEFAEKFNNSIFDASELNKGNLRNVSRFAPLYKIMEL